MIHVSHHGFHTYRYVFFGQLGTVALVLNLVFLASPLSSIREVIRDKDAASISGPLTITIMLCSTFWGLYAIGINDTFLCDALQFI